MKSQSNLFFINSIFYKIKSLFMFNMNPLLPYHITFSFRLISQEIHEQIKYQQFFINNIQYNQKLHIFTKIKSQLNIHKIREMDVKSPMIESTKQIIGNYSISVSLTKQKLIEVNRSLNQLDIMSLVYEAQNQQVRKFIQTQMLVVQKRVMQSTQSSSGLFGIFKSKQSGKSPVSVGDVWIKLADNKNVKNYKKLIEEIANLKKKQDQKS